MPFRNATFPKTAAKAHGYAEKGIIGLKCHASSAAEQYNNSNENSVSSHFYL